VDLIGSSLGELSSSLAVLISKLLASTSIGKSKTGTY
jgi:hypothetical protein